jgi:hypothetical protein
LAGWWDKEIVLRWMPSRSLCNVPFEIPGPRPRIFLVKSIILLLNGELCVHTKSEKAFLFKTTIKLDNNMVDVDILKNKKGNKKGLFIQSKNSQHKW